MVIITDAFYRSAISAIFSFNNLGEKIIAVTTKNHPNPPAFHSKYVKEKYTFPSDKELYKKALLDLCATYDNPIIFPIGVFTLDIISENLNAFAKVSSFCVSSAQILATVNDKEKVKKLAIKEGINVPRLFQEENVNFPLVVKPVCGEKLGLKASERYKIVNSEDELIRAKETYNSENLVIEEYIKGDGVGVSIVMGKGGVPYSAFCHKRRAEYPATGGPSSSLITIKNDALIQSSVKLLQRANFSGIAMVEYKEKDGKFYLLEVNPRIWGSFGATYSAKSDYITGYISASRGVQYKFSPSYKVGVKVKFLPNIFASIISYIKNGQVKCAFRALIDTLNPFVLYPCFSIKDPIPSLLDIFRKRR